MSRRIEDCHPELQMKLLACIQEWANAGLDILVTCTYRSKEEQLALYEQGRTSPGRIVTNAKPGQSAHNYTVSNKPASLAFDVVPMSNGKPVWGTSREDMKVWQQISTIAKAKGLQWAGDWQGHFHEIAHFQLPTADQIMRQT